MAVAVAGAVPFDALRWWVVIAALGAAAIMGASLTADVNADADRASLVAPVDGL